MADSIILRIENPDYKIQPLGTPGPKGDAGVEGPRGKGVAEIVVDPSGDGDFTSIPPALAAVASTGGTVFVKRGTYTLSAPLVVPANTTLRGEGAKTIITIPNAANHNLIEVLSADVTIQDLYVACNGDNQTYAQGNGVVIYGENAKRVSVTNVTVHNSAAYGIVTFPSASGSFLGPDNVVISGCKVFGARQEGIEIGGATNVAVTGNVVRDCLNNGIYVWHNSGAKCESVAVTGNTVIGLVGVYAGIAVGESAVVKNITVSGNTVNGNGAGVGLKANLANSVVFSGNSVHNVSSVGINISASVDVSVSGNSVRSAGSHGIYMGTSTGTISSNSLKTISQNGISIDTCTGGVTIEGNSISAYGSSASNSGINVSVNSTDIVISGNVVTSATAGRGISASGPRNIVVSNEVKASAGDGILLASADSVAESNLVSGNTSGIGIFGQANDQIISGNRVMNSADYGIAANGARSVVSSNQVSYATPVANRAAIFTGASSTSSSITGNVIRNTTQGIDCRGSDTSISGNSVSASTSFGIMIQLPRCTVANNTLVNTGSAGSQHAISLSNAHYASVSGNTIQGATSGNGIYAVTSNGLSLVGNTVEGVTGAGIYLLNCTRASVLSNVCRNSGGTAGIKIERTTGTSNYFTVSGNQCYDDQGVKTQDYGFQIVGSVDSVYHGMNHLVGNLTSAENFDAAATNVVRGV